MNHIGFLVIGNTELKVSIDYEYIPFMPAWDDEPGQDEEWLIEGLTIYTDVDGVEAPNDADYLMESIESELIEIVKEA